MHQRFIERMESYLQKMQQSATSGRLKDLALAQRRLGRVHQRYWRAAGAFDVKITSITSSTGKVKLAVDYTRNQHWNEWATLSEGCYLLRTNLTGVDPKTLWKRYIQLTEAEWAFRIAKDELVIRPTCLSADRYATRRPIESRPTSWCASWRMCSGRHWRNGCTEPAWAMLLELCFRSWPRSRVGMWSCQPVAEGVNPTRGFDYAVWSLRTRPRRCC